MSGTKQERTIFSRVGGGQTVQDESGSWWVRYQTRGHWSKWAPYCGCGKPPGCKKEGRKANVTLPIDKET